MTTENTPEFISLLAISFCFCLASDWPGSPPVRFWHSVLQKAASECHMSPFHNLIQIISPSSVPSRALRVSSSCCSFQLLYYIGLPFFLIAP